MVLVLAGAAATPTPVDLAVSAARKRQVRGHPPAPTAHHKGQAPTLVAPTTGLGAGTGHHVDHHRGPCGTDRAVGRRVVRMVPSWAVHADRTATLAGRRRAGVTWVAPWEVPGAHPWAWVGHPTAVEAQGGRHPRGSSNASTDRRVGRLALVRGSSNSSRVRAGRAGQGREGLRKGSTEALGAMGHAGRHRVVGNRDSPDNASWQLLTAATKVS